MKHQCSRGIVLAVLAAAGAGAAAPASAQGVSAPPVTSGLFGSSKPAPASPQRLNILLAATEAIDTDVPDRLVPRLVPDSLQSHGYSTMLRASGDYSWKRAGTQVRASGSSAFRYYATLNQTRVVASGGAVGFSSQVTSHATLLLNQTVAYSPSYLYLLLPTAPSSVLGTAPQTAPDYRVDQQPSYSYGTTVKLSHDSIAGGKLTATGQFDGVDFRQHVVIERPDLRIYGLESRYSRALSGQTEWSLGYQHRSGEFGYGGPTTENGVVLGFKYSRPLSISRRAEISLDVMPGTVDIPESARFAGLTGRLVRMSTDVNVAYPFRRTWHASANAAHRLEYIATLSQPVFSNAATVALEGFLSRRTYVSMSAGYSDGKSALASRDLAFEMYTGETEVRYALTRSIGVYGGYLHYHYHLRGTTESLLDLPERLERGGVRAGLIVSVPLIGR